VTPRAALVAIARSRLAHFCALGAVIFALAPRAEERRDERSHERPREERQRVEELHVRTIPDRARPVGRAPRGREERLGGWRVKGGACAA